MIRGLGASAYQGMTPEQIAQTRALGQQDTQQMMGFAQGLAQHAQRQEEFTETQRATRRKEKMDLIKTEVNRRLTERQLNLEERREASVRQLREAQSEQAIATAQKMSIDMENRQKMLQLLQNTHVQPRELDEPISLFEAQVFQEAGVQLTYGTASDERIAEELLVDPGTGQSLAVAAFQNPDGTLRIERVGTGEDDAMGIPVEEDRKELLDLQRDAQDTILRYHGVDSLSGLSRDAQPKFLAKQSLAHHLIEEGMTGREAANQAIREVEDYHTALESVADMPTYQFGKVRNRAQLVDSLAKLLEPVIRYRGKLPADVFPRAEVQATLESLGYDEEESRQLLRQAVQRVGQ